MPIRAIEVPVMKKRGNVRERILRVLLNHPQEELTKYRIAKLSEANISWVIETLRRLQKQGLIRGTKVINFRKLIMLWKEWQVQSDRREYMIRNPLDLLRKTKLQYALTTYQAENIVQNYLFPSRVDLYINPKDKEKWHRVLSQEGLVGKGNTRILISGEHVFYGSFVKNNLKIVSIPQLIVDLLNEGGVCVEAAEKLLEKVPKDVLSKL